MVRIAYNGYSAAFDHYGRIIATQDTLAGGRSLMVVDVPVQGVRTIYNMTGDLFAYLCIVATLALTLLAAMTRIRQQSDAG